MSQRKRQPANAPESAAPASAEVSASVEPVRRPDSRREAVAVELCRVDGCPVFEFEPGRGLCHEHFTTRLDLREAAEHG